MDTDYTALMRKSTREAHSVSDALINAKLAFAMSDDQVWADGLLIFYEIFKFLENAIYTNENEHLKLFQIAELMRTKAFESDLTHYLGENWKKNIPRKEIRRYLNYLGKLERNEPELLIAYIYHLYMGLLSGGQILRKKRAVKSKFTIGNGKGNDGYLVTEFALPIDELKRVVRAKTNEACKNINEEMREKIIKEGKMVFQLNNEVVRTIEGTYVVLAKKVLLLTGILFFSFVVYRFFK